MGSECDSIRRPTDRATLATHRGTDPAGVNFSKRSKMSWLITLRLCRLKVAEFLSRSAAGFPPESPPQKSVAHNSGFRRSTGQKRSEEHTSELQSRGHLVC